MGEEKEEGHGLPRKRCGARLAVGEILWADVVREAIRSGGRLLGLAVTLLGPVAEREPSGIEGDRGYTYASRDLGVKGSCL